MSVLIRGVEMPCCCKECIMWNNESSLYGGCLAVSEREGNFDGKTNMEIRQPCCPLVPVPPHGRLIDADALEIEAQKRMLICNKYDNQFQKPYEIMRAIALAPTIIPAEEAEEAAELAPFEFGVVSVKDMHDRAEAEWQKSLLMGCNMDHSPINLQLTESDIAEIVQYLSREGE